MKLRDFIRETMTEIAHGVQLAKIDTKDLWAISPNSIDGERVGEKSYVSFDVAVTVNDSVETQKDGKAGLKAEIEVLGSKLGGGAAGKAGHGTQSVSRISFQVPVYMTAHYRGNKEIAEEIAFYAGVAAKGE